MTCSGSYAVLYAYLILGEDRVCFLLLAGVNEHTRRAVLQQVVARHVVSEGDVCERGAREQEDLVTARLRAQL